MAKGKRGGFFGALLGGLKAIAAPLLGSVGKVIGGLFGGAKTAAKQVDTQAVNNVAKSAQSAIQTGDVRGEASRAAASVRANAMQTARQQYAHSQSTLRREATSQINNYQQQFNRRMQTHYGQTRQQHYGPRSYGPSYGPPPPQSYRGYYGAGFGNKHFKKLEKAAHKHIDKIHNESKKHLVASMKHIKVHGKKGAADMTTTQDLSTTAP